MGIELGHLHSRGRCVHDEHCGALAATNGTQIVAGFIPRVTDVAFALDGMLVGQCASSAETAAVLLLFTGMVLP